MISDWLNKLIGKKETKATVPPQPSISVEEEVKLILEALEPFKRNAYLPVTEEVQAVCSADNKMGGMPYLRATNDWPVCPNCKKHMQLFVQLDMSTLPERQQNGLLQMFYCTTFEDGFECEYQQGGYEAFSKTKVCRLVEVMGKSVQVVPNRSDLFPEKRIKDWKRINDLPHYYEWYELGVDIELSEGAELMLENMFGSVPAQGDKLFGWPYWIQGVEYPSDRNKGTLMNELIFQIDSEVNLPHMFGDAGIGHLTQSPDDPHELTFVWSCS